MNLKVQVKDLNGCEKLMSIEVPSEWVEKEYQDFYSAVARRARIPGFRPGHAPKHVLEIHFQKEAREEVLKQLLGTSFKQAVIQEKIPLVGEPQIELVEFDGKHLKYKAHVESRPKIKIDKYTGLSLERKTAPAKEADIEEILKRIQESHARYEPVEGRAAELGDYLICDYQLSVDGKITERQEGTWIHIQENEYLKGFSTQLVGTHPEEVREVTVTFPQDYGRKEIAAKEGRFSVAVKEIKTKTLPPLDDELAKTFGKHETLQELKEAIRKDIEAHRKREAEVALEQVLLEELAQKSKFDLPKRLVQKRTEALRREEIQGRISRGMKEDEAAKNVNPLEPQLLQAAERQIRISFLIDEIATREHIRAEEADFEIKYRLIAERYGRPAEEVKQYYAGRGEERQSLALQIVSEKTIQWLKDRANVKEVSRVEHEEKGGSK